MMGLAVVAMALLGACKNEGNVLDIPFVEGVVAGEEWQLRFGKASIDVQDRDVEITLYSQSEPSQNACLIVTTNNAHITITAPARTGNYTLPSLDANLSFEQPGTLQSFQATSGFLEITEIVGNRVTGVLQANFDEDNLVEGRFIAEICN